MSATPDDPTKEGLTLDMMDPSAPEFQPVTRRAPSFRERSRLGRISSGSMRISVCRPATRPEALSITA